MAKVTCRGANLQLRCNVSKEVMNHEIVSAISVVRPLDCPCTNTKYGKVLSHSGVIVRTKYEDLLIEYMNESAVYINLVGKYDPNAKSFQFRYYTFRQNPEEVQKPKRKVTVSEFAEKMADFMKGHTFDTFSHNCHHARYLTMKYYGMKTEDPYSNSHSVLYQGILDYFKRYP
ncbi:hypothetical protein GPJ56_003433 [Histomonas meleagridis]|uniref:uncharacterized protein n=1 Tax=Histomonas meleagridis TaxID=135588 RepID=UPI0035595355|nr:hypothetical protein GPJ56_003433 [Histomonas meleagridis]KAH0799125.1 hypothetical protein GO595_007922 [Histomonas meleagridis]